MKKSIKFSSGADFVDKMQKKSKKLDDKLNDNIYVDLSASEIKEEQILDIMIQGNSLDKDEKIISYLGK